MRLISSVVTLLELNAKDPSLTNVGNVLRVTSDCRPN